MIRQLGITLTIGNTTSNLDTAAKTPSMHYQSLDADGKSPMCDGGNGYFVSAFKMVKFGSDCLDVEDR